MPLGGDKSKKSIFFIFFVLKKNYEIIFAVLTLYVAYNHKPTTFTLVYCSKDHPARKLMSCSRAVLPVRHYGWMLFRILFFISLYTNDNINNANTRCRHNFTFKSKGIYLISNLYKNNFFCND